MKKPKTITPSSNSSELAEAPTEKLHHIHRSWTRYSIEAAIIVLALIIMWGIANILFGSIKIGQKNVSGRTSATSLTTLVSEAAEHYRLGIIYPDGQSKTFSLQDMGLQADIPATVRATRSSRHSPGNLLTWWQPVSTDLKIITDQSKFQNFIAQHVQTITQQPKNADLTIENGKVSVTSSVAGKQSSLPNAEQTIKTTVMHWDITPLRLRTLPLAAHISEDSLGSLKNHTEDIVSQHIQIAVGEKTITPNASDIGSWLTFVPSDKTIDVRLNTDTIHEYITEVAKDNSSDPKNQILLDTTGEVLTAGTKGVIVNDTDSAEKDIGQKLLDAKGLKTSLSVTYTDFKTVRAPTTGKWVEVDTTTKRMWAYDQGELVKTFLVSAGAPATPTVTGRYNVYAKYRSQDMRGQNADGSEYFQPNVPYINYFYKDYAIHGNYWRPASYFGNVNSSHGCVGLNVSDSSWFYAWAPVGLTVIIHT